jgi:hypothetical protein
MEADPTDHEAKNIRFEARVKPKPGMRQDEIIQAYVRDGSADIVDLANPNVIVGE